MLCEWIDINDYWPGTFISARGLPITALLRSAEMNNIWYAHIQHLRTNNLWMCCHDNCCYCILPKTWLALDSSMVYMSCKFDANYCRSSVCVTHTQGLNPKVQKVLPWQQWLSDTSHLSAIYPSVVNSGFKKLWKQNGWSSEDVYSIN